MSRSSMRAGLILLVGVSLATSAYGAPPPARQRSGHGQRWWKFAPLRRELKRSGIVASVGIDAGIPGVGVALEHGFAIRPVDVATGKRIKGIFLTASGGIGPLKKSRTFSPTRALRGSESALGPLSRGSPVYGNRVSIPIIPGMLSLGASRSGGLGVSFSGISLFPVMSVLGLPLVRGSASVYLINPNLSKLSAPLLNGVDKVVLVAKKIFHHAKATDKSAPTPTPKPALVPEPAIALRLN